MPDGETRIYCTRFASVIAYFADDGEGGTTLLTELADFALLPQSCINDILRDVRDYVLKTVATELHCPIHQVERRSLDELRRIVHVPEKLRHPWQTRSRSASKRMAR